MKNHIRYIYLFINYCYFFFFLENVENFWSNMCFVNISLTVGRDDAFISYLMMRFMYVFECLAGLIGLIGLIL